MNANDIKNQFDLIARQYDGGRRCFIPCFDDYYVRSVSLVKEIMPYAREIADLGGRDRASDKRNVFALSRGTFHSH